VSWRGAPVFGRWVGEKFIVAALAVATECGPCFAGDHEQSHTAGFGGLSCSDCLIATQCPPCADDHAALKEFHAMWQRILGSSQEAIDTSMQRDLKLAQQEGTHDTVAAPYAADSQKWQLK
jgi:hypothetical protein